MKSILMFIFNLLRFSKKKIRQHTSFETIYFENKSVAKKFLRGIEAIEDKVARNVSNRNLPKEKRPLPPGVFLGQWHKVSERKPEYNKDVFFRLRINGNWHYLSGCMMSINKWYSQDDKWSVHDTDEWTEIPE